MSEDAASKNSSQLGMNPSSSTWDEKLPFSGKGVTCSGWAGHRVVNKPSIGLGNVWGRFRGHEP